MSIKFLWNRAKRLCAMLQPPSGLRPSCSRKSIVKVDVVPDSEFKARHDRPFLSPVATIIQVNSSAGHDCSWRPGRGNRNVIFWQIVCELKKSQITSGSVQTLLENSLFWFRTDAAPHPEEKCWFITKTNVGKINPMCPLCYFHPVKTPAVGLWPGVEPLKVFCHRAAVIAFTQVMFS